MLTSYQMTRHARERSGGRSIPPGIAQIILDYGVSRDAGDGARKYALSAEAAEATPTRFRSRSSESTRGL